MPSKFDNLVILHFSSCLADNELNLFEPDEHYRRQIHRLIEHLVEDRHCRIAIVEPNRRKQTVVARMRSILGSKIDEFLDKRCVVTERENSHGTLAISSPLLIMTNELLSQMQFHQMKMPQKIYLIASFEQLRAFASVAQSSTSVSSHSPRDRYHYIAANKRERSYKGSRPGNSTPKVTADLPWINALLLEIPYSNESWNDMLVNRANAARNLYSDYARPPWYTFFIFFHPGRAHKGLADDLHKKLKGKDTQNTLKRVIKTFMKIDFLVETTIEETKSNQVFFNVAGSFVRRTCAIVQHLIKRLDDADVVPKFAFTGKELLALTKAPNYREPYQKLSAAFTTQSKDSHGGASSSASDKKPDSKLFSAVKNRADQAKELKPFGASGGDSEDESESSEYSLWAEW